MLILFYSLLHSISQKYVKMRREALVFTIFFLSASAVWLLLAALMQAAADRGMYDYATAVLYVPEMVRSALLSVPLAVAGGIVLDLHLRQNS